MSFNVPNRHGPSSVDVVMVVPFDAEPSIGFDAQTDMGIFIELGLSVAVSAVMPSSAKSRPRNAKMADFLRSEQISVLAEGEQCLAQICMVYNADLFAVRRHTGIIAAKTIGVVVDERLATWIEPESNRGALERQLAMISGRFLYFGTNDVARDQLTSQGLKNAEDAWQFHALDSGSFGRVNDRPSHVSTFGTIYMPGNKSLAASIKEFVAQPAGLANHRVMVRSTIDRHLAVPTGEVQRVLGYPFVYRSREQFIQQLDAYILFPTSLDGGGWRQDVYLCLGLGVPVVLPEMLEPLFGEAASYIVNDQSQHWSADDQYSLRELSPPKAFDLFCARDVNAAKKFLNDIGVITHGSYEQRADLEHELNVKDVRAQKSVPRVVFVTSNGAGMGHLTRLLAVARRLDGSVRASFISMSQACPVVASYGFDYEYIPSKGDLGIDGPEWNGYFNRKFAEALDRADADVVVFDGTWPYQGIQLALKSRDEKFVWMRRGMWREETIMTSLIRNTDFDLVIAPGEVAAVYDSGATSRTVDAVAVGPTTVLDRDEVFARVDARTALGIGEDEHVALITLGAGNINSVDQDVSDAVSAIRESAIEWRILMTSSLIAQSSLISNGVESISVYPLAQYAMAFDFVVSATGYNSFHEWISYGVPGLWIPNANTITDDQIGRARYARDYGLGLASLPNEPSSVSQSVRALQKDEVRNGFSAVLRNYNFDNGAHEAARLISNLALEAV